MKAYNYRNEPRRDILFIDCKSFYASVECVERGLDPMDTMLIVMSKAENAGGLVLAASPKAKKVLGISNVSRKHEIPDHPDLITVSPRMALYIKKNLAIANIIKSYVAEDDYFPYSIDEASCDTTHSWHLFANSPWELAIIIRDRIKLELGLVVTICLGDNPLLAKIGMDLEAKKNPDFMAEWRYEDVPTKLWAVEPLSEFWGIGSKTEAKLNRMGIMSMYDLAHANPYILKERLGVIGLQLFAHSHGIDRTILSEPLVSKEKSLSNSQVLNYDYTNQYEIEIVICEMSDQVASRIREKGYQTSSVSLYIRYSRNESSSGFSKQLKVTPTSESSRLKNICLQIFRSNYDPTCAVRQIGITYSKLILSDALQTNLFEDPEKQTQDKELDFLVDKIRNKYGYASLVHASSYLTGGTAISRRDHLIGGH